MFINIIHSIKEKEAVKSCLTFWYVTGSCRTSCLRRRAEYKYLENHTILNKEFKYISSYHYGGFQLRNYTPHFHPVSQLYYKKRKFMSGQKKKR